MCVFGIPSSHKGYRYHDLATRRIIISHHVVFDEFTFPFARESPIHDSSFDFLLDDDSDYCYYPTNPAAPSTSVSAAPSPPIVDEAVPPFTAPRGSDFEPPPGPSASSNSGGRGLVPPSGSPGASPVGGASTTARVQLPEAPPPGCFRGHVYSRRLKAPAPAADLQPPPAPELQPPQPPPYPMTRLHTGTIKPVNYSLSAQLSVASPVPSNYRSALADPSWRAAMADEFKALVDNDTWHLVPRPWCECCDWEVDLQA